jgi:Sap, sulfolipid-1-addressing protein
MLQALGENLPLAIGIAISPVPIIAVILMLMTPKARTNAPAFLGGWLLGLIVVAAVVLVVVGSAEVTTSSSESKTVAAVKLVLGLLLLFLAWRQWRGRPKPGEEAAMPKWMKALDSFTPGRSVAVGALLAGVNPKNLILDASMAAGVAQTGLPGPQQALVVLGLIVVASLGLIVPVAAFLLYGERARGVLGEWKTWLAGNNATVMAVLFLVFGVTLVGKGIAGL